jgi:hypothetical protein
MQTLPSHSYVDRTLKQQPELVAQTLVLFVRYVYRTHLTLAPSNLSAHTKVASYRAHSTQCNLKPLHTTLFGWMLAIMSWKLRCFTVLRYKAWGLGLTLPLQTDMMSRCRPRNVCKELTAYTIRPHLRLDTIHA